MGGAAPDPTICRNCSASLEGPFCARCGQKAAPLNPTVGRLARDVAHELVDLDGRIFRTVRLLLTRPGFLSLEHFAGRRARYISPIRLYLFFSVFFFAASALYASTKDDAELLSSTFQRDWVPRTMFVLVPVAALIVWLVVPRRGRHYPEHFYFALHAHAAYYAADGIASLLWSLEIGVLSLVVALAQAVYFAWYLPEAFRVVYGGTLVRAAVRVILALAIYAPAMVLALAAVSFFVSGTGGG